MGLIRVAQMTKAWLITGGTQAGVMALVGVCARYAEEDLVCLGISSWGAVRGHRDIEEMENGAVACDLANAAGLHTCSTRACVARRGCVPLAFQAA